MTNTNIVVHEPQLNLGKTCEPILRALPQWFGIDEAIVHYVEETDTLPTLLATVDGQTAGFLAIKHHSEFSAEIYVMGVNTEFHRLGVGRALIDKTEQVLKAQHVEFLQVKTLSPAHPDPNYAKTRKFYHSMGFKPLEEFKTLWGEHNPCLQMIKTLK